MANTFREEISTGSRRKVATVNTINEHLKLPQFKGYDFGADSKLLENKFLRFRPRMVGGIGAYSILVDTSYTNIVDQGGMDFFYLFWALGSIQDDFIDELPKDFEGSQMQRKKEIGQTIFGKEKVFYRGVLHALKTGIKGSPLASEEQSYILGRIREWYKFLVSQEGEVLRTPFEDFSFTNCIQYREEQNLMASRALMATLNGNTCLDPKRQKLENQIGDLSYLTQIIDDIADLPEDLAAERPSFAVGALVDNPDELAKTRRVLLAKDLKKVTPGLFKSIAPQAYEQVENQFQLYRQGIEMNFGKDGKGLSLLAQFTYDLFPHVRNMLYRVNPKFANF